ncbi:hypothetical protein NPA31_011850 [Aurantimonas sp. MSK8Z-1]|uniref:hypothetical protein n=1 Tax=Mangrovibrevibacter kandeliae TaxID=2968473 RepID=UPI002118084A|nr:hypothetical protein [Aurantimonas sp. MSK8Z-1]MCW4115657.1 hypothetical protein [Aurantimonas sp. MSK8Z-1]
MPDKKGRFTPREQAFVAAWVPSGDPVYAAEKAGYAHPRQAASQNANNPAIAEEYRRRVQHEMSCEVLPLAVRRHKDILNDKKAPYGALNKAIELVYRFTLGAVGDEAAVKELHQLTGEELHRAIAQLEVYRGEVARRATPVIEHEPAERGPDVDDESPEDTTGSSVFA